MVVDFRSVGGEITVIEGVAAPMVIRLTGEHHKFVAPASVHSMMGNQGLYEITNDELREHVFV